MHFTSSIIAAAALASGAFAKTIPIQVGAMGLAFTPNTTTAQAGDVLEFSFYPRQHNVAQGSFDTPCHTGSIGTPFFSGNVAVSSGKSPTTFSVKVNDTNPIWLYCSEPMHCQLGMVMVVNPPSAGEQTLEAYKSAAAKTSNSTTPFSSAHGGVTSRGSAASSSTRSGNMTSTATITTPKASSTTSGSVENSPMGWAMWASIAGTAALGVVAL